MSNHSSIVDKMLASGGRGRLTTFSTSHSEFYETQSYVLFHHYPISKVVWYAFGSDVICCSQGASATTFQPEISSHHIGTLNNGYPLMNAHGGPLFDIFDHYDYHEILPRLQPLDNNLESLIKDIGHVV